MMPEVWEKWKEGYGRAIKHEWEPFRKEKLPFHYLLTVVDKQRQAAVIMTVSSVQ
jgi:hypothetical protein